MHDHRNVDITKRISLWANDLASDHPTLEPHVTELIDHVSSIVEDQTNAGEDAHQAFASAVQTLGDPKLLANQFRSVDRNVARVEFFGYSVQQRRAQHVIAAAYILFSLAWAGFVLATNELNWMLVGWTATTLLPLSALGTIASCPVNSEDAR